MAETTTTTKKRGRGRPPKKVEHRGGKREGAGRKKGVAVGPYKDSGELVTAHITINVREVTKERVKSLREATKQEETPFNRMFEKWVEERAQDYGIE